MDTMLDFILWMGEIPFSAHPVCEADALVLCMLSYYDFAPVFDLTVNGSVCLRDCQRMLDEDQVKVHIVGKDRGFRQLLQAAVSSRRYGELRMSDYCDLFRQDPPLQFSAVTFHGEDFSFLAYRGTDNSLAGWKEDFMISFVVTEAQEKAKEYAERVIAGDRKYYIGGHSKGGNEALFAACSLSEEKLKRVERVFLLDGPGLCEEVMDTEVIRRIDEKTTRILPESSVIGELFAPQITDTRIVRSNASGLMQHSLDTWGIDHGKLFQAREESGLSRWINGVLSSWIGGITQEDRVVFVNELFDALAADGAETLEDIETKGPGGFEAILLKLLASSETTKKTISDLPKRAILGEYYDEITRKGLTGWLKDLYLDWQKPEDEKAEGGEKHDL